MGRVSQVHSLTPNFTVVALKNVGLQASKSPKVVIFGINFPQRGISPYAIFTKLGTGEELTGPQPRAKFNHCDF